MCRVRIKDRVSEVNANASFTKAAVMIEPAPIKKERRVTAMIFSL
jgi:hypothetical protein